MAWIFKLWLTTQMLNMSFLLCYKVINKTSQLKAFTFKFSINRGIHLFPSEVYMQNSILQALLTHICLIKECVIYSFTPTFSVLFSCSEWCPTAGFHVLDDKTFLGVSAWGKACNLSELCSHRMKYNKVTASFVSYSPVILFQLFHGLRLL